MVYPVLLSWKVPLDATRDSLDGDAVSLFLQVGRAAECFRCREQVRGSSETAPARLAASQAERPGSRQGLSRITRTGRHWPVRGGLTTKIHLLADSGCRPLVRVISAGQRHDSLAFATFMARLTIGRRGPSRPDQASADPG
jgi:hypothetical protein